MNLVRSLGIQFNRLAAGGENYTSQLSRSPLPTKDQSLLMIVYLASGVYSGTCLEELLHPLVAALVGCNDQCSGPTL